MRIGKIKHNKQTRYLADVLEQPLWRNKHITIYDKDTRRELTLNFKE